jgi:hypothetical protein
MQGDPERLAGLGRPGQPVTKAIADRADVEHEHLAGQVIGDHASRRPQRALGARPGRVAQRQRPQDQCGQPGAVQRLGVTGHSLGQGRQQHGRLVRPGRQPLEHGRGLGQQVTLPLPDQPGERAVPGDLLQPGEMPRLRGQRAAPGPVEDVLELADLGGPLGRPVPDRAGQRLDGGAQPGRDPGPPQRGVDFGQRDAERGATPDPVAEQPRRRPSLLGRGADQRHGAVDRLAALQADPDPVDQPAKLRLAEHPPQPLLVAGLCPAGRAAGVPGSLSG